MSLPNQIPSKGFEPTKQGQANSNNVSSSHNLLKQVTLMQYRHKLCANASGFLGMVINFLLFTTVFFTLFSFNGGYGYGGGQLMHGTFGWMRQNSDILIYLSLGFMGIMGVLLPSKGNRNSDFTFVSSHLSHHLSNILLMMTFLLFVSISTPLGAGIARTVAYFTKNRSFMIGQGFTPTLSGLLFLAGYVFLLGFVLMSISYFCGALWSNRPKVAVGLLLMLTLYLFVCLIFSIDIVFGRLVEAFVFETYLGPLAMVCIPLGCLFLAATCILCNHGEVKR